MKVTELFSEKWCECVFRHRNKEYGAYILRKETGRRYTIALSVLFFFVIVTFAPIVVLTYYNKPVKVKLSDPMKHVTRFDGVRIKEARPVRRPMHKQVIPSKEVVETVREKEIVSDVATTELPEEGEVDFDKIQDIPIDSLQVLIKEATLELAKERQQTNGSVVDSIPRYPTGLADFMKWLNRNMIYPRICVNNKQSGKVIAAFIVESSGDVTDVRILEGNIRELNYEVLRVLKRMPKWIPGKRNGKPIRTQVTLPVEFNFDDEPFS